MKNLKNNKGVTLIELVVSFAILALLATAVIGIMNSNTVVFRKNKTDVTIQTSAQETYNKIYEEIMQAKYVYIEGYIADSPVTFPTSKSTGNDRETTTASFTKVKLLSQADLNLMELATLRGVDCSTYLDGLAGSGVVTSREDAAASYTSSYNDDQKKKFNSFFDTIRYWDAYEVERYGDFVDYVDSISGGGPYTAFTDSTIKSGSMSAGFNFADIYITKIVFQYNTPLNENYVTDTSKIVNYTYTYETTDGFGNVTINTATAKADDYCRTTYEFSGTDMNVSTKYGAMDKLDSATGLYTNTLNYVKSSDAGVGNLAGVVAQIDGEKDGIKIDLFFADKSMSYTDRGMVILRNSYVLHNAN